MIHILPSKVLSKIFLWLFLLCTFMTPEDALALRPALDPLA